MKVRFIFIIALFFILNFKVYGHKVNIFAYVEGDKICCESYYPDGSKVKNGQVEVFNNGGKKLLEGKTDDNGNFSFTIPAKQDLKIVINASMGHRAETTVSAGDLPELKENVVSAKAPSGINKMPEEKASLVSTEEIKKIVDETMEEKLRPIYKMLAEQKEQEKVSVTEVIGGIGYIIGIIGVIAFFMKKKKNDE